MLPLGSILPKRLKETGLARGVVVAQILEEARNYLEESLGKALSQSIIVVALEKGGIKLKAGNQNIAQEIMLLESKLIQHINLKFKGKIVDRVCFK